MISKPVRYGLAMLSILGTLTVEPASADSAAEIAGRRIYTEGRLPDGHMLRGLRGDNRDLTGREAACVACHRPSGLGGVEGTTVIPPITGRALFDEGGPVWVRMDRRFDPGLSVPHAPYDAVTFAAAMRHGHHQTGRTMQTLMPRYALSDHELQVLAAYLRTLSREWSPGVSGDEIRFATVIAPDVRPERRQAFLDTLTTAVNQINVSLAAGLRKKIPIDERRLHTRRAWALDVWELSGPSSTWSAQLDRWQAQRPVFAILSGLAGDEWQPVHDFCERARVGCWFPSVELVPAGAEQGRYSLYFSRGVALEAEVVARRVTVVEGRVVQLVASDPVARGAAAAMQRALAARVDETGPRPAMNIAWQPAVAPVVAEAIATLGEQDCLVLWLRPQDLSALGALPPTAARVFLSATLAGDEAAALPPAWRRRATLLQPLEQSRLRAANLERFDAWLSASKQLPVDRRMQSEVYFAVRFLMVTVRGMLNNLHTDYLIERAETTLSMFEAMQVQDEIQAMMMGGGGKGPPRPAAEADRAVMSTVTHRQMSRLDEMSRRRGTTVYPSLSLGPGQRFASKGVYLETLNPDAPGIVGEPEWVVP